MKTVLYFQSGLCESDLAKLEGFRSYAKAAHWRVHTEFCANAATVFHGNSSTDASKWNVRRLIDFWNPTGAVVDCASVYLQVDISEFGNLPTVFLDHDTVSDAVCVTSDAVAIARAAAKVLQSLKCAAYGYVPFGCSVYWSNDRGHAFDVCIRDAGGVCLTFDAHGAVEGSISYRKMLCDWLKSAPRPFGVFAANDAVGVYVLSCAEAVGLKVPDDVAVLGVDDDHSLCDRSTPKLSSIAPDFHRAGYIAAELLDRCISHPRSRVSGAMFGVLDIHRRESTFAYHRHDDRVVAAISYIRQHACERISSAHVIAQMGCARRTAELRFREIVGHGILEEIHAVRLERAKNLLRRTDCSIREIAIDCGYRTTEQLRRIFLRAEGCSPCVYRMRGKCHRSVAQL